MANIVSQVTAWIEEEVERQGAVSVSMPEVTDAIVVRLREEPAALDSFLTHCARPLVYSAVLRYCRRTRAHIIFGNEAILRADLPKRARQRRNWMGRLERVGDRHIQLGEMTRLELARALAYREEAGLVNLRVSALWGRLLEGLPEGKRVKEVYTEEQIDALAARLDVTWQPVEVEVPEEQPEHKAAD